MTPQELMQLIRLPQAACELALRHIPADLAPWRDLLYNDTASLTAQLTPENAPGILIALAADSADAWFAKGISQQVYVDSMYDITLWCEDYYTKHGEYGLSECGWICKSIKMELFRLGRLQFEPITLKEAISLAASDFPAKAAAHAEATALTAPAGTAGSAIHIPAGTAAYSVHIPAGEPLDIAACEASFAAAPEFFTVEKPICVCGSWLLAPELADVLPPSSNILQFQKFFHIISTHPSRQAEERIFGCVLEDPALYPEQTSLQRNAKAYLMAGHTLGSGYGVRI